MARAMSAVRLILGGTYADRLIEDADGLVRQYREKDIGTYYLDHQPATSPDIVVPEDLAVTLAMNSQAGWRAFHSLQMHAPEIDLGVLPKKALDQTTPEERGQIRDLIVQVSGWPGFGASVATKLLHKKRPALIPILDNQAIFGAYMNKRWPERPAMTDTVKDGHRIFQALSYIAFDLGREENHVAWRDLHMIEPTRTSIQLFDATWWMYFRSKQPVQKLTPEG